MVFCPFQSNIGAKYVICYLRSKMKFFIFVTGYRTYIALCGWIYGRYRYDAAASRVLRVNERTKRQFFIENFSVLICYLSVDSKHWFQCINARLRNSNISGYKFLEPTEPFFFICLITYEFNTHACLIKFFLFRYALFLSCCFHFPLK